MLLFINMEESITTTKNQLPILGSYARGKNSRKSSSRRLKSLSFILFNSARSFGPPYVRCAMYCLASRTEAFHTLTRSCGTTSGGTHLIIDSCEPPNGSFDGSVTGHIFVGPYLGVLFLFFAGVVKLFSGLRFVTEREREIYVQNPFLPDCCSRFLIF